MTNTKENNIRAKQISRRNDTFNDVKIGLYNIDAALKYYFDSVIKPVVLTKDDQISVPLKYASPERWKSILKDNFIRDKYNQIMLPAMVYKKNNIARNTDLPMNKISVANPQIFYTVAEKYNIKNRYNSIFAKIAENEKLRDKHVVVMPTFITVSYDIILWTTYLEQMNYLIETLMYHNNDYWGNEYFKFMTSIEDFSIDHTISTGADRIIKSTSTIELKGYILPDIYSKTLPNQVKTTVKKLSVDMSI